jgi:putative mRNA 3-end processing factor
MTEIKFLGGANEVGKEAILVKTGSENILLDYGTNVQTMEPPMQPDVPVDAIFLSHAHLDHSGYIPLLYKNGYKKGVWATNETFELSRLLLEDSLKVQKRKGLTSKFAVNDINTMYANKRVLGYNQPIPIGKTKITMYNAGHIPGSSSTLVDTGKKRILFTGDIKFTPTEISPGADTSYKNIDVLISESTYSYKDHPDRGILAKGLRDHVDTVVKRGGTAILPCFAVGRTQEMLVNLSGMGIPVYLDGMGIKATEAMLRYPSSLKDPEEVRRAFRDAIKIRSSRQRKDVLRKNCVIIATAGMLQAGAVTYYIKKLYNDDKNSLILTGYQVEGTPGRELLDTGRFILDDMDIVPRMEVRYLDFSDHCDKQNLMRFFNKIKPKKIVLVHGDRTAEFCEDLKKKGFDVQAPKAGDIIKD